MAWLTEVDEDRVFMSVVTLAELRHGIERLAKGARRHRLNRWLTDELPSRFDGRVLPVDAAVADAWGRLVAHREALGRPIGMADAFVAATVQVHGFTLVTRNVSDFQHTLHNREPLDASLAPSRRSRHTSRPGVADQRIVLSARPHGER